MPRLPRAATAALLAASLALVALPACKKSKPTESDSPAPGGPAMPPMPGPPPAPIPQTGANAPRDPNAPRGPFFGSATEAPMRLAAESDLKQIGLAIHNYHDAMNALPSAIVDRTGKPLLSWRVAILPYLDQNNLYQQFKLDEPWDGPNNKALVSRMPKQYAPPRTDTFGYTFYRGFSGPGTWLPPAVGGRPQAVRLSGFTDGTSNTILVAEAAEAVVWTKPDEMELSPNKPIPAVGGVFGSGTHVLLADGSVRRLKKGFDPQMLALLIQIADGNVVNWD